MKKKEEITMINLCLSLRRCFLPYAIIWVLFVIPSCVLSVDKRHLHCSHLFKCGNQTELYYPFWTADREECGHPDFEVTCSGDFAEFSISSVKFQILEMNYESRIVRLARKDYLNNLCPQHLETALINKEVLPLYKDTEVLTFFYNCSDHPVDYISQLQCWPDDTYEESYFVRKEFPSSHEFTSSCKKTIDVAVSRSALKTAEINQSEETIKKALDKGFELTFNRDCSRCVKSKGSCGYNQQLREFVCYCINEPHKHTCGEGNLLSVGIGFACGFVGATLIIGFLFCFFFEKIEALTHPRIENFEELVPLKQYSYEEVKEITNSFAQEIGKGGFGIVYGGTIGDGLKVAVKVLKESKSNGEDFINEVASMSRTSHVHIVSLLGYCYESSKRAIIYEFVENGSLDKFISGEASSKIDLRKMYEISLGVARGLQYLHYACKTRIIHFDIKPHNVLLGKDLCPKISDFGIARLCGSKESVLLMSKTVGTIGYIAPEVFSRMYGKVSHKSDVYSYGMLVLEMIGARSRSSVSNNNNSSMYFPDWIYTDLEKKECKRLLNEEITEDEDEDFAKKMVLVGLSCIQACPSDRPSMNRVVEMMEGSLSALEAPPKSLLHLTASLMLPLSFPKEDSSVSFQV
ncbi:LEAF RUST 10 DISEASE-RESISTANCE LOCUS RECEPTOR-LIKE PROTEIN KINASE-like 2.1 isoform X3 [Capsella rubella]|nr:LEAF RUST 10 DISEASE-RESISTANCE LOCUS RECEPTOR-LIKE PROTEIN KINASE-like 2.1 isoform X3 [Capsella rubella]